MGCLPIRFIIKSRRIMFLHYILNQKENSLIFKFFKAQLENPVKGDWSEQVKSDISEIDLKLTMEEISMLSRESFRTKLKKAINAAAFKWLMEEKVNKSKLKDLNYEKLEMQNYLGINNLETSEKKFLFLMRTRMLDIKSNFRNGHSDFYCHLCGGNLDQKHILECKKLLENNTDILRGKAEYSDIFHKDITKQTSILRIFRNLWKKRNIMNEGWHPIKVSHVI